MNLGVEPPNIEATKCTVRSIETYDHKTSPTKKDGPRLTMVTIVQNKPNAPPFLAIIVIWMLIKLKVGALE